MRSVPAQQTDLFAAEPDRAGTRLAEPVPEDFIQGIRTELHATLKRATDAANLPWRDYTQSALAEMRFESLCNWLPPAEAKTLWENFGEQLDRLYAAEPAQPDEQPAP
jgi:hypothetical protein